MSGPSDRIEIFAPPGMIHEWLACALHTVVCENSSAGWKIAVLWTSGTTGCDVERFARQLARRGFSGLVLISAGCSDDLLAVGLQTPSIAVGVLSQTSTQNVLADAIRAVSQGSRYVDSQLQVEPRTRPFALTKRELQVAALLNATNPAIATELGIGVESVKTHVRAILRKTDKRSRHEAFHAVEREHAIDGIPSLD